jgi:hypothetical protein
VAAQLLDGARQAMTRGVIRAGVQPELDGADAPGHQLVLPRRRRRAAHRFGMRLQGQRGIGGHQAVLRAGEKQQPERRFQCGDMAGLGCLPARAPVFRAAARSGR